MSKPPGEGAGSSDAVTPLTDSWSERDILAEAQALGKVGAWAWLASTQQVWWSGEMYRIFGRDYETVPATVESMWQYVHPDDLEEVARRTRAAVEKGEDYDLEHRIIRPDGQVRYVWARGVVKRDETGQPLRMTGMVMDITDDVMLQRQRDDAVRQLAESEERHRLLAENAWDVIWTMGVDGSITYVSPSVQRVRGFTPAEAAAQTLDQIHTPDSARQVTEYFTALYAAMAAGEVPPIYHGEREYYRKDGSIMLGELQVIPQVDDNGNVVQILGVTRDVSDRRHFEDELNRLAVTDPLTGVWNRRQGDRLFVADLAEARRSGNAVSLLMVDIDGFKKVNDTHGHQVGDQVLVTISQILNDQLRSSDILARWGGDEFVILLPQCTSADAAVIAEKLRERVSATEIDGLGPLTVSIGVAEMNTDDDRDSLLRWADIAMYRAKSGGRNAVEVYS